MLICDVPPSMCPCRGSSRPGGVLQREVLHPRIFQRGGRQARQLHRCELFTTAPTSPLVYTDRSPRQQKADHWSCAHRPCIVHSLLAVLIALIHACAKFFISALVLCVRLSRELILLSEGVLFARLLHKSFYTFLIIT